MGKGLKYIDLFAGAGGLSEGFIQSGYTPIAHVEIDKAASYTLKTRIAYYYLLENNKLFIYNKYLKGEVSRRELYELVPTELLSSVINAPIGHENNSFIFSAIDAQGPGEVDLIIGGPPCQAYSLVGRARSETRMELDPRNYLYLEYEKYLQKYNPKVFIFENVIGLKSANGGKYFQSMLTIFTKLGYEVSHFTLEADNFGVLQKRRRIILIGCKKELQLGIPKIPEFRIENSTVSDVLSDLPALDAGGGVDKYATYTGAVNNYLNESRIRSVHDQYLTQHFCRPNSSQDKEIYKLAVHKWDNENSRLRYDELPDGLKTHKNTKSFYDRFKVVAANLPASQTVVAHIAKDGHYYIHPDLYQNRSLTVREAARLQSFPDNFYFEGVKEGATRSAAFKQIGNAVPPLMARSIAEHILKLL